MQQQDEESEAEEESDEEEEVERDDEVSAENRGEGAKTPPPGKQGLS